MRKLTAIGVITMLLGACGWMQSDYDAGHSNANQWENHVTLANVATLEDRTVPPPDPAHAIQQFITANGRLVLSDRANVYAYSTSTCPTADGSPCSLLWQAPAASSTALASDGQRLFISTGLGIDVRTLDGAQLGHLAFGGAQITVDRGTVYTTQTVIDVVTFPPSPLRHYTVRHDLYRFPADCDPSECAPENLGTWDGPTLITSLSFDTSGSPVTVSGGRPYHARIRDGHAVQADGVRDLSDPACQTPALACAPVATFDGITTVEAVSPGHVLGRYSTYNTDGSLNTNELRWFPGAGASCAGPCAPLAHVATSPPTAVAVGGDVVYVKSPAGLDAYAEDGVTNCTGATQKTCRAVAHFATSGPGPIEVVDRRVYALDSSGIHILTIPGDVS